MDNEEGKILASGAGQVALQLLSVIGARENPRVRKGLMAFSVGTTAYDTFKQWRLNRLTASIYTVAVLGDDVIYPDVHHWVLDRLPASNRRAIIVRSLKQNQRNYDESAGPHKLHMYYDGSRAQFVDIDGHRVSVMVERPTISANSNDKSGMVFDGPSRERIIFTCYSQQARDAVLELLKSLTVEVGTRPPRFFTAQRWGGWVNRSDAPQRPLESVILKAGQKEELVSDLQNFLASEETYNFWGMPYHRGYLLHGAPGTGKTSIASALATHLGLDVYYIALGSVENDGALAELLSCVDARSVLLLEDIDVVHGAKTRDDTEKGVSLAGLLNALDGFITPHGLITIMTTNNRSVLDPALIRPGRVDVDAYIGFLDWEQLLDVFQEFIPDVQVRLPATTEQVLGMGVSPAEIIGVLKDNMNDPQAGARAIEQFFSHYAYDESGK